MPGKLCGRDPRAYIRNATAYCEGLRAQGRVEDRSSNPHNPAIDPVAFEDWDNGWLAKQGVACCGGTSTRQLLVNGRFEKDLTGWQSNNANLTWVESYSGASGGIMRIADGGGFTSAYQTFQTTIGQVYEARCYINAEPSPAYLRASNVSDINSNSYIEQYETTGSGEWQELFLRFTAQEAQSVIRVQTENTNLAHVSDISVRELCQIQSRYVWFETNTQTALDDWLAVADEWYKIGDHIATARRDSVIGFVNQMLAVVDEVQSGFKTSDFFDYVGGDTPYDSNLWGQVADLARQVYELTGNPVVLDNEGNMTNIQNDFATTIDSDQLRDALRPHDWPPIWFWTGPAARQEPRRQMQWDFAIGWQQGVLTSNFIESNTAGYNDFPNDPPSRENDQRTADLDDSPKSIHYLDDVISNQWDLARAWESTQYARYQTSIIYPGISDVNNYAVVQASFASPACSFN